MRNTYLITCLILILFFVVSNSAFSAALLTEIRGIHSGTMPSQGGIQLQRTMSDPIWFGDDESFSDWDIRLRFSFYRSQSVALGDVDNDGRLDVLSNDDSRLYLHYGTDDTINQWRVLSNTK